MLLLAAGFAVENTKIRLIIFSGKANNQHHANCKKTLLPAATMGVASFPFDMEGPNFATGALKVNPAYKNEKLVVINVTIAYVCIPNKSVIVKRLFS